MARVRPHISPSELRLLSVMLQNIKHLETGHWYAGGQFLILPANVARISHEDFSVFVNLPKETLARTTKDEFAHTGGRCVIMLDSQPLRFSR